MQMYCSNVGGWLWRADATEFTCKVHESVNAASYKSSKFLLLFSLLEYTQGELHNMVKVSSFLCLGAHAPKAYGSRFVCQSVILYVCNSVFSEVAIN